MRPIEIALILANLLAFFAAAAPPRLAVPWLRHSSLFALLIAAGQVLIEGPRWQMIPAYALAGLFFLAWVLRNIAPAGRVATSRLGARLVAGLGVLGLVISGALPILFPVFHFPPPSGPYTIGTMTYHWVDADRQEILGADPNAHRELMAQIWYPAEGTPSSPRAPYVEQTNAVIALTKLAHLPWFLFSHVKYVATNAIPSAPVAEGEPRYPVLIFLEGLTGFRQMNTFQVEELASHGYIVVALDQPYAASEVVFPDGRQVDLPLEQVHPLVGASYIPPERTPTLNGRELKDGIIPYFAQDAIFTLNQLSALNQADPNGILTGRLDLQRAGTFGVSLGGIVAGEACRMEPRLRACLVMDAPMPTDVVKAGLQQPGMWITRNADTMRLERQRAGGWPEEEIVAHQTSMRAVFEHLPGDGYFVQVPGMFHSNLTDIPLWTPLFRWLGFAGPIDVERAHSIINAYSLAFFDQYLKARPAALLRELAEQYPEVEFESRRP